MASRSVQPFSKGTSVWPTSPGLPNWLKGLQPRAPKAQGPPKPKQNFFYTEFDRRNAVQCFMCVQCMVIVDFQVSAVLICYRLPSVCRLSVCNVGAPYSAGWNFRQFFFAVWYLGHPLTSTENFTEIVPGEPVRRGFKRKRGSEI